MKTQEKFPSEVAKQLKYYVYRLIDPRNGQTFYVGKGKGDRVFTHAKGGIDTDELSEKMARIREIKLAGFEVGHVIHRHGMESEDTAFEVEAALIDAFPGLSNAVDGHGNSERGVMHSDEIINRYMAEEVVFQHKALLISVNKTAVESSIYEATRFAWRINKSKTEMADIVLSTVQGLVVGVFVAEKWLPATSENFPGRETIKGRWGFTGCEAHKDLQKLYMRKKLPQQLRRQGAANPIKYSWSDS